MKILSAVALYFQSILEIPVIYCSYIVTKMKRNKRKITITQSSKEFDIFSKMYCVVLDCPHLLSTNPHPTALTTNPNDIYYYQNLRKSV